MTRKRPQARQRDAQGPPKRESGVRDVEQYQPRRHQRHAVSVSLRFAAQRPSVEEPAVAARCDNLSLGGMFVRTPEPPPVDTALRIWLALPAGELLVMGVVRWICADGMGIQHELLGASDAQVLGDFLSMQR